MHPNQFLVLLRPGVWAWVQALQLEVQQQVLVRLTPVRALWLEVQQPHREEGWADPESSLLQLLLLPRLLQQT